MKILFLASVLVVFSFESSGQTDHLQDQPELKVSGTKFEMNGKPFEYTGISFFNALYNTEFNKSREARTGYIRRFNDTGINVLRVWCQWDNGRGFADGGAGKTMYLPGGKLNPEVLSRLKGLLEDAGKSNTVILLVLFSRESWNEKIRLGDKESENAVQELARVLKPYRNLVFQVWNEFSYRTLDYLKIIKSEDPGRLVTNSPGYAGELGSLEENRALDYLSPHTTRDDGRHWEIASSEIKYLVEKFGKPVVDDEPARKGTSQFGGPKNPTDPKDHILHIYNVWKAGGYVVYHHDMFQTGYGSEAVPPSGIPLPGFSVYHDQVFAFLREKDRYLRLLGR
jgi:hypothetical protein